MSDDDTSTWQSNQGVTLPDRATATHDAGLSPIFFMRSGRENDGNGIVYAIVGRGEVGFSWSNAIQNENQPFYTVINLNNSYPSSFNPSFLGFSLRCLVSTTNS